MITFLEGELVERQPTHVVMNVGGVGYEVFIPLSSFDRLPPEGSTCRLLTWEYLREDAHLLYGFTAEDDRRLFRLLLDVSGVGPRTALSALSGLSSREFKAAVVSGDIKRLSSISGIGRKTAERIVVELKDKIGEAEALEAVAGADALKPGDLRARDAMLALIALGFKQAEAAEAVRRLSPTLSDAAPVEELVRKALASR